MGLFDTFIDGDKSVQVKIFNCKFEVFKVGDQVPKFSRRSRKKSTFTIVLPKYEGAKFVLIKEGVFIGLTDDVKKTYPPYMGKWGEPLMSPELESNPYEDLVVEALSKEKQ